MTMQTVGNATVVEPIDHVGVRNETTNFKIIFEDTLGALAALFSTHGSCCWIAWQSFGDFLLIYSLRFPQKTSLLKKMKYNDVTHLFRIKKQSPWSSLYFELLAFYNLFALYWFYETLK